MSASSSVCSTHPGSKLSRDCIQDTLIAKRTGVFKESGLMAKLCAANLRLLRETQLSQHIETKLIANRYWVWQAIKRYRPGGCKCCWEDFNPAEYMQRADNPLVQELCGNDLFLCEPCLHTVLSEAETMTADTLIIYMKGGIVDWLALPNTPVRSYLVADADVFEYGGIGMPGFLCTFSGGAETRNEDYRIGGEARCVNGY